MAPITTTPTRAQQALSPIYLWSADQYKRMIQAGILGENDQVELLEEVLVPAMPIGAAHRASTCQTWIAFERLIPPGWHVDQQGPIQTAQSSPEPGLVVVRGQPFDYQDLPDPPNVALVVEVADSPLDQDRTTKLRIYARAAISIYGIINLIDRQLEVYEQPSGRSATPGYGATRIYGPDEAVPVVLDGVEVGRLMVRDLLPPASL
jgi:hypothetical protein